MYQNRFLPERMTKRWVWSVWAKVPGGEPTPGKPRVAGGRMTSYLLVQGTDTAIYANPAF
jgi:hypothetical protein